LPRLRSGSWLRLTSSSFLVALFLVPSAARSAEKTIVRDMKDVFYQSTPLTPTGGQTPAVAETTIFHKVFFDDMETGITDGWGVVDFRAGQPNAWHIVSGTHACVGNTWWMGQTGLAYGDGYDNNWVQSLKTNVPIDLTGTTGNKLTFKYRFQSEYNYDWGWVLIKPSGTGAYWDTLAQYSGDFGASCNNASIDIPDSFTTKTQPITLQFLFGSDLDSSTADTGTFPTSGWSLDDVKITASGNNVRFFDDMESGPSKWLATAPDPGTLWHLENAPATSLPASCYFLNTYVWVPFIGFGFGSVPDWADAMLTTPTMDLQGIFEGTPLNTTLRLQYDNWVNLPFQRGLYWSLWIQGSDDLTTWTPWHNALFPLVFSSGSTQCNEGLTLNFNPYNTSRTGVQPGTRYIRLGFRLRDDRAVTQDGQILTLGQTTEGIYFDDVGVYYVYTISGVEEVPTATAPSRASIRKVFPNPFNPSTTIEFAVPSTGKTALRIYDVRGRRQATLVNQEMGPGVYRIRWSGKSDDGRDLSSGVYFARVETRMGSDAVRVMMIK
jgi:hypothetical protein